MERHQRLQVILKMMAELRLERTKKQLKEMEEKFNTEREKKQMLQRQLKGNEEFVKQLQERLEGEIFNLLKIDEITHNKEALKIKHEKEMDLIKKMLEQKLEECDVKKK